MQKSFIERIFPHPPTSTYKHFADDDYGSPVHPRSSSSRSPRPIVLQDSVVTSSSSHRRRGSSNGSSSSVSNYDRVVSQQTLSSPSLVRHNDPFLPVERAARNLERTLQDLLDAQSEGLAAAGLGGVGEGNGYSSTTSVGSPTPTPSVVVTSMTVPLHQEPRTIPIRQPKKKRVTLKDARRGLSRSLAQFAALKEHELKIIDGEVVARDDALKQASDLDNRKRLLDAQVHQIQDRAVAVDLRSEAQQVEQEITELETKLLELRNRHRRLLDQVREHESSHDSELSSYMEALKLNENNTRHFLRRPPVSQGVGRGGDDVQGMYAFKPERRTLQMAQDQWTNDLDLLNSRRAGVEKERQALDEGGRLWHDVAHRIREFEKDVRGRTKGMTQSRLALDVKDDGEVSAVPTDDTTMESVVEKMNALVDFLQEASAKAETEGWKLLMCAIGAELAAFQEARHALDDSSLSLTNGDLGGRARGKNARDAFVDEDEAHQDDPHQELLGEVATSDVVADVNVHAKTPGFDIDTRDSTKSPSEESNHSLEATLRQFGRGVGKKEGQDGEHQTVSNAAENANGPLSAADVLGGSTGIGGEVGDDGGGGGGGGDGDGGDYTDFKSQTDTKVRVRGHTSESEDEDEPGPEFLLSHT
ncbi:hypothetical protein H2204_006421 [Knufia peltigerae]|uniref:Uncharacterized protein n=1 Tax=Knufia peltigerae TaxID=1002370 RepID=A0AA38Y3X3_9EURO|nr:hypothetical protein H2204_006421 [Knufia peltigerae]